MPHNLFLHSSLVQTRRIGKTEADLRRACRFNLVDSTIALNGAMFVNAAILILAAAVFFRAGKPVDDLEQAYQLLSPLLGATAASVLFGVALLCSGQSSTITGTLAGQIVMEGFLNIRVRPWLRRLVTRALAVIPAAFMVWHAGGAGATRLILLTQLVLSAQLPFAIIPLIHFTNDPGRMGPFANKPWLRVFSWASAALIVGLNVWLLQQMLTDLAKQTGAAVIALLDGLTGHLHRAAALARMADLCAGIAPVAPQSSAIPSTCSRRAWMNWRFPAISASWLRWIIRRSISKPSRTLQPWRGRTTPNSSCCTWKKA